MSPLATDWRSPDAKQNVHSLRVAFPHLFNAVSEWDAFGHRLMHRSVAAGPVDTADRLVGLAMIRRSVTLFVGIRALFESSAIEPCKVIVRAQFESALAARYLLHGARRKPPQDGVSAAWGREVRARYYLAAADRQAVYDLQGLLDQRNGPPAPTKRRRAGIQAEMRAYLHRLETAYSTQHRRYGELRCFSPPGKGRRYHDERKWYSFGFKQSRKGGRPAVNSVQALATRLGWGPLYLLLYSPFSELTHPTGVTHDIHFEGGRAALFSPYLAEAFEILAFYSIIWQQNTLHGLAAAHHPDSVEDAAETHSRTSAALDRVQLRVPAGWL